MLSRLLAFFKPDPSWPAENERQSAMLAAAAEAAGAPLPVPKPPRTHPFADVPREAFNERERAALEALWYYKVEAYWYGDDHGERELSLWVPRQLTPEEHVEIGYLVAKIARDDFPGNYRRFGFSTDGWEADHDPAARFLDRCSDEGYRLRIRLA